MAEIRAMLMRKYIKGVTTNPTLLRKAGVADYLGFAQKLVSEFPSHKISLEVLSDEFPEMKRQARLLNSLGKNIYVKIPITNSRGESSLDLIEELSKDGIKVNVTAVMTLRQVQNTAFRLSWDENSIISVFSGRIADTGRDPVPIMRAAKEWIANAPTIHLLWASTREVYNIYQAEECGCDIITVPNVILNKAEDMVGSDLDELSLDTVQMFTNDAREAGLTL